MNLFEFIAILSVVGGLVTGFWYALDRGVMAAMLSAIRGGAIAYGCWAVGMFALMGLLSLFLLYRPFFPRCRNGRCRQQDYLYLYLDTEAVGQHKTLEDTINGKLVRCGCGTIYLESSREQRFYEVLDDGTLVPYMRYSPFGRWRADNADAP
jgi:hypothetical protein